MLRLGITNEERSKAEDEALAKAGFQHGRHRFLISTADTLAQATALAPLSIYPFPPDICAELICDHLAIVSCLEMPALTSALSSAGFEAVQEAVNPDINRPDAPIARGIYKGHAISINSSALQQIALEFLDVTRQAEAMLEAVSATGTSAGIGVLTLTNETATWR